MALQDLKFLVQDGIPQITARHLRYLQAAHLNGKLPQVLDDMAYLFQVNRAALWNGLVVASKGAASQSVRNAAQGAIGFIGMLEAGAWAASSTAAITAAEVSAGIAMAETGSAAGGIFAAARSVGGRFFGALARLLGGAATRSGAASLFGVVGLAAVLIAGGVIWIYNNPPDRTPSPTYTPQPGRTGTPIGDRGASSAAGRAHYCNQPSQKALYTAYSDEVQGVVLCYCDCSIPGNCYGPPDPVCYRHIPPQFRPR